MGEEPIKIVDRLERIVEMLKVLEEETEQLSRNGQDLHRDLLLHIDKEKIQNISKLIKSIN
jgi:hypothetical protein